MERIRAGESQPTELPIACTLDGERLAVRGERWQRVIQSALRSREPMPDGIRLIFEPGSETVAELTELVGLERECCGFASWELSADEQAVVLDVGSRGDGVAAIQAMF